MYLNLKNYEKKYLKYKNKYLILKNKIVDTVGILNGGECDLLPYPEDFDVISGENLLDLCPDERITIQDRCYEVETLYEFIIKYKRNFLPDTMQVITEEEKEKLVEAYITKTFNLSSEEKITIQNKCYQVKGLYEWVIKSKNNKLPLTQILITPEEKQNLIQAYETLPVIPNILTRNQVIYENNQDSGILNFINQEGTDKYTGIEPGIFDNLPVYDNMELKGIYLSKNEIKELPPGIFSNNLLFLQYLDLSHNKIIKLEQNIFNNLPSLTDLYIAWNRIRELQSDIFYNIPRLENLNLNNNQIQELQPGIFDNLPNLQFLNLSKNKIRELQPGTFGNNLSKLQRLYLDHNQIIEFEVDVFNNLIRLEELCLHNNQITELPVGIFDNLPVLKKLSLENNRIIELQSGIFDYLLNLQDLILNNNQIIELKVDIFNKLNKLKNLSLQNNEILELQSGIFKNLPNLYYVGLHNNRIRDLQSKSYYGLHSNVSWLI